MYVVSSAHIMRLEMTSQKLFELLLEENLGGILLLV